MSRVIPISLWVIAACLLGAGAGCERERTSGAGLHLPEGDVEQGRVAFVELGCNRCHSVEGVDLPAYAGATSFDLHLGGEVVVVKTYGQLLTSITNPDHILSPKYRQMLGDAASGEVHTPMPSFNDTMTVSQLINLVTFLDSHYQKMDAYYSYRYPAPY